MENNLVYNQTVLLVEDEPIIRMMMVDSFEDHGFRVLEASSAKDALELLARREDIAALFTDVEMPGRMDGYDLAKESRQSHPHIAVVIASGRRMPGPGDLPPGGKFIPKPYLPENVVTTVCEMMLAG